MEIVLLLGLALADDNGVTRVVAASATSADIRLVGENVDELTLALVSPLGAETGGRARSSVQGQTGRDRQPSARKMRETGGRAGDEEGTHTTVTPLVVAESG